MKKRLLAALLLVAMLAAMLPVTAQAADSAWSELTSDTIEIFVDTINRADAESFIAKQNPASIAYKLHVVYGTSYISGELYYDTLCCIDGAVQEIAVSYGYSNLKELSQNDNTSVYVMGTCKKAADYSWRSMPADAIAITPENTGLGHADAIQIANAKGIADTTGKVIVVYSCDEAGLLKAVGFLNGWCTGPLEDELTAEELRSEIAAGTSKAYIIGSCTSVGQFMWEPVTDNTATLSPYTTVDAAIAMEIAEAHGLASTWQEFVVYASNHLDYDTGEKLYDMIVFRDGAFFDTMYDISLSDIKFFMADDATVYVIGGAPTIGWNGMGGSWCYYDQYGNLKTGWFKVGSTWYYAKKNGIMQTGWVNSSGKWYYLQSSGAMATSKWIKDGSKWYYVGSDGAMATSKWIKSGSKWYYVGSDGAMATSKWIKDGSKWYYVGSDGAMATNKWIKSSGKWYYVGSDGVMYTSKWKLTDGNWYYLKSDGVMAVSESLTIGGKKYNFDANGVCTNP